MSSDKFCSTLLVCPKHFLSLSKRSSSSFNSFVNSVSAPSSLSSFLFPNHTYVRVYSTAPALSLAAALVRRLRAIVLNSAHKTHSFGVLRGGLNANSCVVFNNLAHSHQHQRPHPCKEGCSFYDLLPRRIRHLSESVLFLIMDQSPCFVHVNRG